MSEHIKPLSGTERTVDYIMSLAEDVYDYTWGITLPAWVTDLSLVSFWRITPGVL